MANDPHNLLLNKFISVQQIAFKDRPSAVQRLGQITTGNSVINVSVDPNDPTKRVATIDSDSLMIHATKQGWLPASLAGSVVGKFTNPTVQADLNTVSNINSKGLYKYTDTDGVTTQVSQIVLTNFTDFQSVLNQAIIQFNQSFTNFQINSSNVSLKTTLSNGWVIHVDADTFVGDITLLRYDESKSIKGNDELGYLGQVLSVNFIDPTALALSVGFSQSQIINPDTIWLKFRYRGNVIYITQKPIVNNIQYADMVNKKVLSGKDVLTAFNGDTYFVGSPYGQTSDPAPNIWNDLIYRVHASDPTGTFWEKFTNTDMAIGLDANSAHQPGNYNFTNVLVNTNVMTRGGNSLTQNDQLSTSAVASVYYGWRPVLVLNGAKDVVTDPKVSINGLTSLQILNTLSTVLYYAKRVENVNVTTTLDRVIVKSLAYANTVTGFRRIVPGQAGTAIPFKSSVTINKVVTGFRTFKVGLLNLDKVVNQPSIIKTAVLTPHRPIVDNTPQKLYITK